jgi:hypothetical protein
MSTADRTGSTAITTWRGGLPQVTAQARRAQKGMPVELLTARTAHLPVKGKLPSLKR